MRYNLDNLVEQYDRNESLDFLFFWGHTAKGDASVGKHIFSQWYLAPFTVEGITYLTAEHWMMAQKALLFKNYDIFSKIIACIKPGEAKQLGREVIGYDDFVWRRFRTDIVKTGNIHKFNQNRLLGEYLIKTDQKILVEASPVDNIWGIGLSSDANDIENVYTWKGQNLLGFILMEIRDFLKENAFFTSIDLSIKPPWVAYPNITSDNIFWSDGIGKSYLLRFSEELNQLTNNQKNIYHICHPTPYNW